MNPFLSVAVLTYNQEKFIAQTLESILLQKHAYTYEIIVGDDCSSDNTKNIIESYVEKYPDIIKPLYNRVNTGLIKNYFNILSHCNGEYIMQCAGDDYWLPGKVEKQIAYMKNNNECGLLYSKVFYFYENEKKFSTVSLGGSETNFSMLLYKHVIPAVTLVFKNSLYRQYYREIEPNLKSWQMEDYPLVLWFSLKSKISFLDDVTAVYRVILSSVSHSSNLEKNTRFLNSVEDVSMYYLKLSQLESTDIKDRVFRRIANDAIISKNRKLAISYLMKIVRKQPMDTIKLLICKSFFYIYCYKSNFY